MFEILSTIWKELHSPTGTAIALSLFALSEALGGIKSVEESSVYQVIMKGMRLIKEKIYPTAK